MFRVVFVKLSFRTSVEDRNVVKQACIQGRQGEEGKRLSPARLKQV